MKNYVKQGQKLPLYGVGPYLVYGMATITLIGIVLSGNILRSGQLSGRWIVFFRIAGTFAVLSGFIIWFISALHSGMDDNIADNKLKTDGIYAWVRNPMYSGWWIMIFGISLLWHNYWLLIVPVINWGIMSIVLKKTEEKWLLDLYGEEYRVYVKKVNRCIPWPPRV